MAHHFIKAGDYERGLTYSKRAAAEAERVFAFEDAIAAYGCARDCAQTLELTDEQLELEEAIGKLYFLHGEMLPAGEHFERALALTTNPAIRARLQCQAAASLIALSDQRGVEYLREALAVLDPVTNPLETANALSIEGRFHHLAGRQKQAIELLERAAGLVEPATAADEVSSFAASIISQIYAYTSGAYQQNAVVQAMRFTRDAGKVVIVGQYTDHGPVSNEVAFNPHLDLNKKHLDVHGCWGSDFSHFYRAAQILSDPARSTPWVILQPKLSRFSLTQGNEALAAVRSGQVLKALIDPRAS
ncbi:MAG: hypothetical protein M3R52_12160 [Acidobacteriota bacterium]|nr:hypothetical protein [Acidobacteriota bacterium]